jgi:hypothetical protein
LKRGNGVKAVIYRGLVGNSFPSLRRHVLKLVLVHAFVNECAQITAIFLQEYGRAVELNLDACQTVLDPASPEKHTSRPASNTICARTA